MPWKNDCRAMKPNVTQSVVMPISPVAKNVAAMPASIPARTNVALTSHFRGPSFSALGVNSGIVA